MWNFFEFKREHNTADVAIASTAPWKRISASTTRLMSHLSAASDIRLKRSKRSGWRVTSWRVWEKKSNVPTAGELETRL